MGSRFLRSFLDKFSMKKFWMGIDNNLSLNCSQTTKVQVRRNYWWVVHDIWVDLNNIPNPRAWNIKPIFAPIIRQEIRSEQTSWKSSSNNRIFFHRKKVRIWAVNAFECFVFNDIHIEWKSPIQFHWTKLNSPEPSVAKLRDWYQVFIWITKFLLTCVRFGTTNEFDRNMRSLAAVIVVDLLLTKHLQFKQCQLCFE